MVQGGIILRQILVLQLWPDGIDLPDVQGFQQDFTVPGGKGQAAIFVGWRDDAGDAEAIVDKNFQNGFVTKDVKGA